MRDVTRQRRRENYVKVTFPEFPSFSLLPYKVEIFQRMGRHDIVQIHYGELTSRMLDGITTGAIVKVEWSNDKAKGELLCYKTETSYRTSTSRGRTATITCIGVTFPLKESGYKIWKNKSASEIATEIARMFKLKPVVSTFPVKFTQNSMAGQSYWEKLNELSDTVGYAMQVKGSELHFHPVDVMIDKFLTSVPKLVISDVGAETTAVYEGRTLEYFEPQLGDYIETRTHRRTEKIVGGVDPITGKPYKSTKSPNKVGKKIKNKTKEPLFSQIETRTVTGSRSMAEAVAEAKAQWSRLSVPAKGGGQGDPNIAPWRTVEVRGTEDAAEGVWIIESAHHTLYANNEYYVEFTCLSDGTGRKLSDSRIAGASEVPVRNIASELGSGTTATPTSTTLSVQVPVINESNTGYNITPRRLGAS